MEKNIKDYLHYYFDCECVEAMIVPGQHLSWDESKITSRTLFNVHQKLSEVKPLLRKLESMSEEEMTGLLMSMTPTDMEDKPDADAYDLEMFYNDGGLQVDSNVAVGANYSCICYEGQIAIRYNGDIDMFDEEGKREQVTNQTAAFNYLRSKGFDCDGLIAAGLAIEKQPATV